MGEIADDIIDDMFDSYWDNLEEYDYDEIDHIVFTKRLLECKYCKGKNYHWEQTEDGSWRLYTPTGRLHTCNKYKPKEVMHGNNS